MWRRRSNGQEDPSEESSHQFEDTSVDVSHNVAPAKPLSFKKKREMEDKTSRSVSYDTQSSTGDFESDGESLEAQILVLQEQLVVAIIENQNLVEQMKLLKAIGSQEELSQQLEIEKERNRILSEKIRKFEKDKETTLSEPETNEKEKILSNRDKSPRSPSRSRFGWRKRGLEKSKSLDQSEFLSSLSPEDDDEVAQGPNTSMECFTEFEYPHKDLSEEGSKSVDSGAAIPQKSPLRRKIEEWVVRKLSILIEDFSVVAEEDSIPADDEGEHLTVRKLKENVVRFSAIMRPLNDLSAGFKSLLRWESPAATFLALSTYLAAIFKGYIVTMVFILAILSLSKNYFKKKGWPFRLLRSTKNRETTEEGDGGGESKLGDKFAVVLQVAKRVQNVLGAASDTAEKMKNLLLWEHEATTQLYMMLWIVLIASLLLWPSQLFTLFGLYLGLKIFVVDFIFFKFPRIRRKYDSTSRLWDTLPTDADLEKRNDKNGISPTDLNTFLELFNLPPSEVPLQGWQGGKRCTLVNRDKSLTSAFRNGRLYLTNSYLCFERSKNNPEKNVKLAVCDVVTMEKANSYPWIPGGGMAIEILAASGKAYFFGGIINRDEVFDAILDSCRRLGHSGKKKEKEREKEKERDKDREKENEKDKENKVDECSAQEIRRSSDSQNDVTNKQNGTEAKMSFPEVID